MRDQLVERLENANYPVAEIEVVENGDDLLEIVAKLVSTAVDPNELNAVAVDLQRQSGVRHATWEVKHQRLAWTLARFHARKARGTILQVADR